MWIIYHGYKGVSMPLMAAILHQHFYPSLVGSDKKAALPFWNFDNCFETNIYHLWKQALSARYAGGLTCFGSDSYGNQIYVLERRRVFAILERTIRVTMDLTGNREQVLFMDTSGCRNFSLELGIWLWRPLCQVWAGSGSDKDREYTTRFCLSMCTLGDALIQHGIKRALPRLVDLVKSLEQQLC